MRVSSGLGFVLNATVTRDKLKDCEGGHQTVSMVSITTMVGTSEAVELPSVPRGGEEDDNRRLMVEWERGAPSPPPYSEVIQQTIITINEDDCPPRYSDVFEDVPCFSDNAEIEGVDHSSGSNSRLFFALGCVAVMVVVVAALTLSTALSLTSRR